MLVVIAFAKDRAASRANIQPSSILVFVDMLSYGESTEIYNIIRVVKYEYDGYFKL